MSERLFTPCTSADRCLGSFAASMLIEDMWTDELLLEHLSAYLHSAHGSTLLTYVTESRLRMTFATRHSGNHIMCNRIYAEVSSFKEFLSDYGLTFSFFNPIFPPLFDFTIGHAFVLAVVVVGSDSDASDTTLLIMAVSFLRLLKWSLGWRQHKRSLLGLSIYI